MPQKKVFSGMVDYASRNIHDDFLELLPQPTNESSHMKMLFSVNPRLKIVDGLYDRGNWVRDAIMTKTGLHLFKKWFSERKLFAPHGNIWNFDLGKLVVSGVFMDFDLLMAIAQIYDPTTRIVRRVDRECLM